MNKNKFKKAEIFQKKNSQYACEDDFVAVSKEIVIKKGDAHLLIMCDPVFDSKDGNYFKLKFKKRLPGSNLLLDGYYCATFSENLYKSICLILDKKVVGRLIETIQLNKSVACSWSSENQPLFLDSF